MHFGRERRARADGPRRSPRGESVTGLARDSVVLTRYRFHMRSPHSSARLLAAILAIAILAALVSCGSSDAPKQHVSGSTGSTASGAGSANPGGVAGGAGLGANNGGAGSAAGGAVGSGGAVGNSGGSGAAGGPTLVTPGSYALAAPDQCKNQFYVAGCQDGMAASTCGGVCTSRNACEDGKTGDPGFACSRYMLFADEMAQAAKDDAQAYGWSTSDDSPFEYAVVGHDTDSDANGLDDAGKTPCCQCYQLIPYEPEQQVKDQATMQSAVPLPKPLIVQTFNTGATTKTFDMYMGHGGLGAQNACSPDSPPNQYTSYPADGQPNGGGIKAVGEWGNNSPCKDQNNLVTLQTLSSDGCQSKVATACNNITADTSSITEVTRRSCIDSNKPESLYHMNWKVYAKRVKCPAALTQVTGCKLVENEPEPTASVLTPSAAEADASFKTGYSTTTMQDCCKPSCAWSDNVTGAQGGHTAEGNYNSFYTCDVAGKPLTQP